MARCSALHRTCARGDAVVIGRQHVATASRRCRRRKSGETVTVTIPILPVLARTLAAGPCGDLAFICGARGHPLTKELRQCVQGRVPSAGTMKGKAAHGLRKVGATRAAENGATVAELEALFGWRGGTMASLYTRTPTGRGWPKVRSRKLEERPMNIFPRTR